MVAERLNYVGLAGAVLPDKDRFEAVLVEVDVDVFEVLEAADS